MPFLSNTISRVGQTDDLAAEELFAVCSYPRFVWGRWSIMVSDAATLGTVQLVIRYKDRLGNMTSFAPTAVSLLSTGLTGGDFVFWEYGDAEITWEVNKASVVGDFEYGLMIDADWNPAS